jgi:hypothetical protein
MGCTEDDAVAVKDDPLDVAHGRAAGDTPFVSVGVEMEPQQHHHHHHLDEGGAEEERRQEFVGLEAYEVGTVAMHGFWQPVQRIASLQDGSDIWVHCSESIIIMMIAVVVVVLVVVVRK